MLFNRNIKQHLNIIVEVNGVSSIILEMRNITKTFPGVKALDQVNLKIKEPNFQYT